MPPGAQPRDIYARVPNRLPVGSAAPRGFWETGRARLLTDLWRASEHGLGSRCHHRHSTGVFPAGLKASCSSHFVTPFSFRGSHLVPAIPEGALQASETPGTYCEQWASGDEFCRRAEQPVPSPRREGARPPWPSDVGPGWRGRYTFLGPEAGARVAPTAFLQGPPHSSPKRRSFWTSTADAEAGR
ncbi:UNVERIFIED_CONTAM: hypothetical protein K2H54_037952 [Gekko kuhli]